MSNTKVIRSMKYYFGFALLIILSFELPFVQGADLEVLVQNSSCFPPKYARGIQYGSLYTFVSASNPKGIYSSHITEDGGMTWSTLAVLNNGINVSDSYKIDYYNKGYGVFHINDDVFIKGKENNQWIKYSSSLNSIVLKGSIGWRLFCLSKPSIKKQLYRTGDGGLSWDPIKAGEVWFDGFDTFDTIKTRMIIACVYCFSKNDKIQRQLAKTDDGGLSWKVMVNFDSTLGIWPTHIYFLNETTGWVSSDRDDGLFVTKNGGVTWAPIKIPERTAMGIYFRNVKQGRILGGISGDIYETMDSGLNWVKISKNKIIDETFNGYYLGAPLWRWNDFAVARTLLKSQSE
jgi:hypothetical protein